MENGSLRRGLALVVLCSLPASLTAQESQIIAGRITTDGGVVIPNADVIVTIAPSAETIAGKSDSIGAYRIVIPKPTGEYILYITALGRRPFRQRVTMSLHDTLATVNAKLAPAVTRVAAVQVQARRARPPRSLGADAGRGTDATDKTVDGVSGALPPDQQGDFDAMASFIPGLSLTPTGVSAYGLAPENNSTTLNGLAFGGSDIPRDVQSATRFRSSPWDPTVGGFNGVQVATTLASGGNIARRRAHITLDAPALQFSDPVASRLGQKFTGLALDEGGVGAYRLDKLYYNFGLHVARQSSPTTSLADVDPEALARSGVSPDSAAHLVNLLATLGIPVTVGGVPSDRTTTTVSFIERVDRAPPSTRAGAPPGPTLGATVIARYSQSQAQALSPSTAPGSGAKSTSGIAGVQGIYSRYFGRNGDYVNEMTSGISLSSAHSAPYLDLPGGSVLVASDIGLGSLAFGGNSALANDTRSWTWETINQTGFLLRGKQSLPMKLYLQSRLDGYDQSVAANRLGRFNFNSLSDLAANQPASFLRTLNAPDRSGGEWTGAAALGGNWNGSSVTLTGGVRLDANVFTAAPAYNPDVDRIFGSRTDHTPNTLDLSPRLGFIWRYGSPSGYLFASTGNATVGRSLTQIRGGIGKFRGLLPPTLLAVATSSTGLSGSAVQLLCIGSAVPPPDWTRYEQSLSSVPSTCAGGASTFADAAPAVALIDRGFRAPESWRASLGWTSDAFLGTYLSVDGTYSLNRQQPGTIDLNFTGEPRFALPDEGDRPVFVDETDIAAATGAVSPVHARRAATYGRIADRVSNLRSDAKQIAVYAIPNMPLRFGVILLGYTYSNARVQSIGFDGSTAGDPRVVEWAPSSFTPTHQVTLQMSRFFFGATIGATFGLRASSGFAYTPLIGSDINGDGSSNDRAYVFDPTTAADPAAGKALSQLLSSGSRSARECLDSQLGRIAARNSCVGPWYATANGNIGWYNIPRTDNRVRAFLSFANIVGAVDELLHGTQLHGWGMLPLPDPVLYRVRGFDAAGRRFSYEVNPRFGDASPATTTRRNPFRITLDVQVDLGRSTQEQQVEQNMRVRPSLVGTRAPADSIKLRYMRGFTDVYAVLLRYADSLALSRDQTERFRAEQTVLKQRADSIYGSLAADLAALPVDFDRRSAARRAVSAGDAMWNAVYAEAPFIQSILTPGQIRLLPGGLHEMVTVPNYRGRFFY